MRPHRTYTLPVDGCLFPSRSPACDIFDTDTDTDCNSLCL